VTTYLKNLIERDTYNKYCVDCQENKSTHASVSYGLFLCETCAKGHLQMVNGSRFQALVKPIFGEWWDDYSLEAVSSGLGGNKKFYDYMVSYGL
jgi:hypothetical protein